MKYEEPATLNLYVYCRNNPVLLTDPSGTDIFSDIIQAALELLDDWSEGSASAGDSIGDTLNYLNENYITNFFDPNTGSTIESTVKAVGFGFVVAAGTILIAEGTYLVADGVTTGMTVGDSVQYCIYEMQGKFYVHAYSINKGVEYATDMFGPGCPSTVPGYVVQTISTAYNQYYGRK